MFLCIICVKRIINHAINRIIRIINCTINYKQYYCVNWISRLTLLDIRTNWTHEHTLRTEPVGI